MLTRCNSCLCALTNYEVAHDIEKCDLCTNDLYCRWCDPDSAWRRPIKEYVLIENKEHLVLRPDVNVGELKFVGSWE